MFYHRFEHEPRMDPLNEAEILWEYELESQRVRPWEESLNRGGSEVDIPLNNLREEASQKNQHLSDNSLQHPPQDSLEAFDR